MTVIRLARPDPGVLACTQGCCNELWHGANARALACTRSTHNAITHKRTRSTGLSSARTAVGHQRSASAQYVRRASARRLRALLEQSARTSETVIYVIRSCHVEYTHTHDRAVQAFAVKMVLQQISFCAALRRLEHSADIILRKLAQPPMCSIVFLATVGRASDSLDHRVPSYRGAYGIGFM